MRRTRLLLALLGIATAFPALGGSASGSFVVSLRVLPRVRSGLPGGARAALVSTTASTTAVPCGAERSEACAEAIARAASTGSPVLVTLLPDGAPTAIVER